MCETKQFSSKFDQGFKWLEKTAQIKLASETLTVYLGDYFVKTDLPGQALCKLCSKHINYGSRGCIALGDHVRSSKHVCLLKQKRSNYNIDTFMKQHIDEPEQVKVQLSASGSPQPSSSEAKTTPQRVHMCDRIANAEVSEQFTF